jgi:hypothetical protein
MREQMVRKERHTGGSASFDSLSFSFKFSSFSFLLAFSSFFFCSCFFAFASFSFACCSGESLAS